MENDAIEKPKTKLLRLRNGGGIESWYTEAEAEAYKTVIPETLQKVWAPGWSLVGSVEVDNAERDNADEIWAEQQKAAGKGAETPAVEKKGKGK